MEWVGQPNQSIPFSDFEEGEPNGPTHELYMVMMKRFDFKWNDYPCDHQSSYICELMQR